jgi:parvulin-like peptidyl-prolyl isomerase
MTYRAKPVVRPRRSFLDRPDRRNFLINLGFALVVVVALAVLALAAFMSWYDAHLKPVASVNGQGITQDELQRRFDVESARLSIAESRIRDEFNAGRLTAEQRDAQLQFLGQREQQLPSLALERLIDAKVQADLASQRNIQVTDADVDGQIAEEATRPEQRRVYVIEVEPKVEEGAEEPTAAAKAEAKAKAEQALEDVQGGKDWVEVSKSVSTASTASDGGDQGWVTEDFSADQAFSDAVFALDAPGITALFEDPEDGIWRIGRVTEIVAERVESDYPALMAARGVSRETYREVVRQDLPGEKLREQIEQEALAEGKQRLVSEIYLENQALPEELPEGAVKARHILYAPKDDGEGAADLDENDPAWAAAEQEARKAYDELKADISKFDAKAREESDEGAATVSGGKLPWFDPSMTASGQLDSAFGAALFKEGIEAGQLLEPVRTSFGWHVIQVMYTISDEEQAKKLKEQIADGADFADLARDYSAGAEAEEGGDRGWIARYQLDPKSEAAIFATPIGEVTDPVVVDGDGVHLYLVRDEEVRTPEGDQKTELESSAFSNWYQEQKKEFTITRDISFDGTV